MELLIERGATIDGPDGSSAVNARLRNGRGEAAEFFANRGARLDLEGAAGVGRLDVVKTFFNDDGSLRPPATVREMRTVLHGRVSSAARVSSISCCRAVWKSMRGSSITDRPASFGCLRRA
jgi:hypothetical protein